MMQERRVPLRHILLRGVAPLTVVLVLALVLVIVHNVSTSSGASVTRVTGTVDLGRAATITNEQVVTEGPNGNVYVAYGSTIKIVRGTKAPVTLLHASGTVLAIAATSANLFIETAKSISEYELAGAPWEGSWNLPADIAPAAITQAGMSIDNGHLWTWTDWSTDESGYEYASITEVPSLTTWTNDVIAKNTAAPGDVAASALGYFYLNNDRFVRGEPNGTQVRSTVTGDASEAPVATWGTTAWLLASRGATSANYLDTYNATTMTRIRAVHLTHETWGILGTRSGLWGIEDHSVPVGTDAYVVAINDKTGAETALVNVPGAVALLSGPKAAVLVERASHLFLDWLS